MFNYNYYSKKLSTFTKDMGLVFPAPGLELLPVQITPLEMLASEALFSLFHVLGSKLPVRPYLCSLMYYGKSSNRHGSR